MSKLKFKKLKESAGGVAAASGFWYHKVKKPVDSINPIENFDFDYIGTYPLQRRVYVWFEGGYICILFSVPNVDKISSMIVLGGVEALGREQVISPAELIKNLDWKFVKKDEYPETYHQTNAMVTYIADKIKLEGGLIASGFPEGWSLDISSKTMSTSDIKNKLNK